MTNDELLHKWVEGTLTPAEQTEFQARPEYEELIAVYKHTAHLEVPDFDQQEMLKHVLATPKASAKVLSMNRWIPLAIAASVLVLLGVWFGWPGPSHDSTRFASGVGEQLEGSLPDQSTFVLNAGSELAYDASGWEEKRSLTLQGEAYFSVEKGSTFSVETSLGTVQVIGTRFNVKSRGDFFEVQCQEGKVRVLNGESEEVALLEATDVISWQGDEAPQLREASEGQTPSWTRGITRLQNVPIREVIDELQRQYEVEIKQVDDRIDLEKRISCNFTHQDLKLALRTTALGQADIEAEMDADGSVLLRSSAH